MAKEIDIGAYSAYAIAVEHGYQGTEAEFAAQLMNSAANGALAQDGAERAEAAAAEAAEIRASIPEDYTTLSERAVENTEKIGQLSEDIGDAKTAYLGTNCAEMVSLLALQEKTSVGGITFIPSNNGRKITTTGTAISSNTYSLWEGDISKSPFKAGGKYFVKYTAPSGAYLQILRDGVTEIVNTASFDGQREITIPADVEKLTIRLFLLKTAENGVHDVSIVNARNEDYLETARFTERPTIADLSVLTGLIHENLFASIETTNGKYVNSSTGALGTLASFSATDYFKVVPGATYKLSHRTSGSQIAFYDSQKAYVSGFETASNTFTVPENSDILFARWCADTANISNWGLYIEPITEQKVKHITPVEGILAGVIDAYAKGVRQIIVEPGAYDIISEYKAYYGDDYFNNYEDNYNGRANGNFDCGVWLENVYIVFSAGVTVNANYDGANPYVKEWFSAFAIGQDVTIDGLVLDASEMRYGLHPDYHGNPTETLVVKNCDLHHYKASSAGVNNNQAIGAGVGVYATWNIENCIFRSDTSNPVVRIHNNASSQAKSRIVIKDCYIIGAGYILLNSYSTSTKETTALVTGCSWKNPAVVGKETQDSNDNIVMYAWSNETRQ